MSVWDDLMNGVSNIPSDIGSALGSLGSTVGAGLSDAAKFVGGTNANAVNGSAPLQDTNILTKLGLGLMGPDAVQGYKQNYNLAKLGQDFSSGNIDQGQYLKGVAAYDPKLYGQMSIAQQRFQPAAQKNNAQIQQYLDAAQSAAANGDTAGAQAYTDKANTLMSLARSEAYGVPTFQAPGQTPAAQPTAAPTNLPPAGAPAFGNNTPGQTPAEKAAALLPTDAAPIPASSLADRIAAKGRVIENQKEEGKNSSDIAAAEPKAENTAAGSETPKYSDELATSAKAAMGLHQTIGEIRNAMQSVQTGQLAPAQAAIIRAAKAVGYPISADEISQLDNAQVISKLANSLVGMAAKQEGGASRLASAYTGIVKSTPNLGMEPGAISTVLDGMDAAAAAVTNEQQAWSKAKTANPKLTAADFQNSYTATQAANQEKAGGALPQYGNGNPAAYSPANANALKTGQPLPEENIPTGGNVLAPKSNSGLPQGTKTNSDGTFTLPDGRIVRKKK